MTAFPTHAARSYLDGPPRQVPGFGDLHRLIHCCSQSACRQTANYW
jgi:hypothetical protein